ncbi:hypothetical protein B0A48_12027 [Cryoendolithus antarcticus]|uniref:Uncharacterized protein n=1 Tax=Cryoendolithus antarcticus TaxID=1507870 RepID=A0A1V8STW9_9PEZI|nr:hypothetical protein B0A48_12027 [Cryoendolithus antarcticus]
MASKSLFQLLRVLDDRDTGLGRDDVASAFEDSVTKATTEQWIEEYLSTKTLLTQEEYVFHQKHAVSSGRPKESASRPLTDSDLEKAIQSLEASTSAIKKQCQLMEAQKRALLDLKARDAAEGDSQTRVDHQRKLTRDKAQLSFEVDEQAGGLQTRLRESSKRIESTTSGLPATTERILDKDDRLLDGLQKSVPKLQSQGHDDVTREEVDRLCSAFNALEGRAIRSSLDAIYHSHASSVANGSSRKGSQSPRKEISEVKVELAELSSEIPSLLSLVSEGYYRQPILQSLSRGEQDSQAETARWSSYIALTLHYLTTRLEVLDEHVQHAQTHRAALTATEAALSSLLVPASSLTRQESSKSSSLAAAQKGLKPLRLVQANFTEPTDPVAQILRLLDVKVPTPAGTSDVDSDKLVAMLAQAKRERSGRLAALSHTTEAAMTGQLGASSAKADEDVADLLAAVYAYTDFGTKRLEDAELRTGVEALEGRTKRIGEQMQTLDLDSLGAEVKRTVASITAAA